MVLIIESKIAILKIVKTDDRHFLLYLMVKIIRNFGMSYFTTYISFI
jgi:hypothetical protein